MHLCHNSQNFHSYILPLSLKKVFARLKAGFQTVFLRHTKKQPTTVFSQSFDAGLLEQALFFALYKALKNQNTKAN